MNTELLFLFQEALNSRWRLKWHVVTQNNAPGTSTRALSTLPNPPPKLCDVWIERGYRRNRSEIVEPKLMWSEVAQPHLHKKHILSGSTIRPYRVSLLAVRRIVRVESEEEREVEGDVGVGTDACKGNIPKKQPNAPQLAKPNCLLLVRSSLGDDYFFEASCPEERDRVVHLWKMATARLVSHAVVGDGERMIQEFFNECKVAGGVNTSLIKTDG